MGSYASTQQQDNRQIVESGGLGIAANANSNIIGGAGLTVGNNASVAFSTNFSPEIQAAFSSALNLAGAISDKAFTQIGNVNQDLGERLNRIEQGSSTILVDITKYLIVGAAIYFIGKRFIK